MVTILPVREKAVRRSVYVAPGWRKEYQGIKAVFRKCRRDACIPSKEIGLTLYSTTIHRSSVLLSLSKFAPILTIFLSPASYWIA